ncbi:arylamine N-acetyltransferase [Streptomyces sp. NPDC006658]|uniref:arylamine N-acetyltransferase n=1 Tax=Streptomyces sp. NPDC006658 TaxID=3156900 RepID=UPI0033FE526F
MTFLSPAAVEGVTEWLGLPEPPAPTLDGLRQVYSRWCTRVPFDNMLIRQSLAAGALVIRGMRPEEFLRTAREQGVGNLCMESAEALHALLSAYGFDAALGLCQIGGDSGTLRANHVTVLVAIGSTRYIVDTTLLTGFPLPLVHGARLSGVVPYAVDRDPDGFWELSTLTLVGRRPKLIRLLAVTRVPEVSEALYQSLQGADYRAANCVFFAQLRTDDGAIITFSRGSLYRTTPSGVEHTALPDSAAARQTLVDSFGMTPSVASKLPPDT